MEPDTRSVRRHSGIVTAEAVSERGTTPASGVASGAIAGGIVVKSAVKGLVLSPRDFLLYSTG